jgi:hypothetical protein
LVRGYVITGRKTTSSRSETGLAPNATECCRNVHTAPELSCGDRRDDRVRKADIIYTCTNAVGRRITLPLGIQFIARLQAYTASELSVPNVVNFSVLQGIVSIYFVVAFGRNTSIDAIVCFLLYEFSTLLSLTLCFPLLPNSIHLHSLLFTHHFCVIGVNLAWWPGCSTAYNDDKDSYLQQAQHDCDIGDHHSTQELELFFGRETAPSGLILTGVLQFELGGPKPQFDLHPTRVRSIR